MQARVPPHDLQAEASLLGACLLSKTAMETALNLLGPNDFYTPAHGTIFAAMAKLWAEGQPIDPVTVSGEIQKQGLLDSIGGPATLVSLQANTPAVSNAGKYATMVGEMAGFRRTIEIANDLASRCMNLEKDPHSLIESALAEFASIGVKIGDIPSDLWQLDEFLDRPEADRAPWAIPGLIRVGWRIMVVAAEGVGKTVLFRQLAMMAAQGIHPFLFTPMPSCRALIVDLENPEDSILDVCNPIREKVLNKVDEYDPERAWLWHRPAGINLRNRADRLALESVIAHTNPDLVCLGPLYKAYSVEARENDEQAAREVMTVLDDLRTRYSFGLLMEHHAPKGSGGSKREMMPYGTSLWMRWPEMGIGLQPEGQSLETLTLGRWRGDRLENAWPTKIHRAQAWPWEGEFENSTYMPPRQSAPPMRPEAVQSIDLDDYAPSDYSLDEPF